ncbi:GNAT family N-acetyltransferase [Chlorella sorokiniana]|uniref:GNAT family N-acetyltransferase n=1 Tax=Chlorella sorokiniana TaxID=3076 RepID=A0A2P6TH96_CHLSO|nr:GNAT family N-acetyltransferase [Chlorella sorokiniana]|eukprot:PRW33663.1 GNAT family N-acetyltransferase [Chlorella sorokiniana]
MLRHICSLADERRLHAYLEASTHRSKELYARHGFVHVADKPLGDEEGAPVLKVMVRSPSSTAVGAAVEAQGAVEQAAAAAGQADSVETD